MKLRKLRKWMRGHSRRTALLQKLDRELSACRDIHRVMLHRQQWDAATRERDRGIQCVKRIIWVLDGGFGLARYLAWSEPPQIRSYAWPTVLAANVAGLIAWMVQAPVLLAIFIGIACAKVFLALDAYRRERV